MHTDERQNSFSAIIGKLVYKRRCQLNMSQKELAKHSSTTQMRISLLENAKGNIRQDIMDRVFEVLQLANIEASYIERREEG